MNMDATIEEIQRRLLEMGKAITSILEEQEIPYMLAYGTLLGAVRHKGFIPWDDDFDLYLFDDTYEQAIRALREQLPDSMFVEDEQSEPLYFHAWAHVKDLKSEARFSEYPQDGSYSHRGISVDLYKATAMPRCDLEQWVNSENVKYLERRKEKGLISQSEYVRRKASTFQMICKEDTVQTDQRKIYGVITGYNCKYYEPSDIFPLEKIAFEDACFYAPAKAHNILKNIYGDYMKLPPEEKRIPHMEYVKFFD